jgi:hypothetical protein
MPLVWRSSSWHVVRLGLRREYGRPTYQRVKNDSGAREHRVMGDAGGRSTSDSDNRTTLLIWAGKGDLAARGAVRA